MSLTVSTQVNTQQNTTKGYLVHENPIKRAKSTVKGYAQNAKYLVNGVNAKGDDYSVGKVNDLTTKLGGLGIAAILAGMTKNPVSKAMEFTGLASFVAAMSIWPKVIAAPIKAKAGFDVNQEYVDSYDRRKRFFEDPQYLPWDLWKKEDLDKVGDKLHIAKDIPNRTEATQAKMKQISTQANTLWMLTTGFATPLMASLMGNYASKYIEKVTETSRVQSAIKQTGMEDFTKANSSKLQKVFVDPVAKLFSSKKAVDTSFLNNPSIKDAAKFDDMLKNLDSAYDAIFGKGVDAAFEFNKASKLYKGVPADMKLTQFDEKTGKTIVKDLSGKVVDKIKTKNVDGISMLGDKWKVIPNKMADILGISPKEYKQITKNILNQGQNGTVNHESEEIAEILIRKFAGPENKENLKKALNKAESILNPAMKQLDDASGSYKSVLDKTVAAMKSIVPTDANAKKVLEDKIKFVGETQQVRLNNKVLNTKISWTSPVRILDIIAKHSNDDMKNPAVKDSLKKELSEFIYGVTPHHINNNFDDVVKGNFVAPARYVQGIKKYFGKLSETTKSMMSSDLAKNIDNTTDSVSKSLLKLMNPADKGKNFENICEWLGKTPDKLLTDAAKQNGIYRGWLKKVGGAFAILTGITLIAATQFGKDNEYTKGSKNQ